MKPIASAPMSERSDRLMQAFRESAAYKSGLTSTRAVSERYGWSADSFKSNLNGHAPFGFPKAKRYADAFGVRPEWLYDGRGPIREPSRPIRSPVEIPVVAWVSAGKVADIGDVEQLGEEERITVGGLPPGDYFATDVKGDSMDRVSPEGSRIIVNAADKSPRSGGFYLFSLRGEPTFKRYQGSPVKRLEPFSTNPANQTIFLDDKGWTVIGKVVRSIIDLP